MSVDRVSAFGNNSRESEWQGRIHSHSFQSYGVQVFGIVGGVRVDLVVGFEGAADLVLESVVDGWGAEKVVSDTAEGRGGCFASCCSMTMVQLDARQCMGRILTHTKSDAWAANWMSLIPLTSLFSKIRVKKSGLSLGFFNLLSSQFRLSMFLIRLEKGEPFDQVNGVSLVYFGVLYELFDLSGHHSHHDLSKHWKSTHSIRQSALPQGFRDKINPKVQFTCPQMSAKTTSDLLCIPTRLESPKGFPKSKTANNIKSRQIKP